MPKSLALALTAAALSLLGCREHLHRSVTVTLAPDFATRSVVFTCDKSSTGKCFVSVAGAKPSQVTFEPGQTVKVVNIPSGSGYCAEVRSDLLAHCTAATIPDDRSTVTHRFEDTNPRSE